MLSKSSAQLPESRLKKMVKGDITQNTHNLYAQGGFKAKYERVCNLPIETVAALMAKILHNCVQARQQFL